MPYGVVELWDKTKTSFFLVNRQRVKHYYGVDMDHKKEAIDLADEWSNDIELYYNGKSGAAWEATYGKVFLILHFYS